MSAAAGGPPAPERARGDVSARVGRLPVRMRLTLSFAVVMVVLFGLIALLLYFIFAAGLDTSINTSLSTRVNELTPVIDQKKLHTTLVSKAGAFAQIVDARSGDLLDPAFGTLAASPRELHRQGFADHNGNRLLVAPLHGPLTNDVLVVGVSLNQRNGGAEHAGRAALLRRPDRAADRVRGGLRPRRARARSGRADAPARGGHLWQPLGCATPGARHA